MEVVNDPKIFPKFIYIKGDVFYSEKKRRCHSLNHIAKRWISGSYDQVLGSEKNALSPVY